jgi:hypothetical protein
MRTSLAIAAAILTWAGAAQALPQTTQTPFTGDNHQNMMDQLGIKTLRPGPSSDDSAVNHANYDEDKANPYPDWPEILKLKNGKTVTTADQWWKLRRPEIQADFETEVYGRIPANTPKVTWQALVSEKETISMRAVTATQLVGRVDNSAYPELSVDIDMTLLLPTDADRHPVPVLIMFGPARFPAPRPPSEDEMKRVNAAAQAELVARDPSLAAVFAAHPTLQVVNVPPANIDSRISDLIANGWGVALLNPTSFQADNGAGLTKGIIGLVNKGQPRKPDDWGALRAWGWGASRALDYLSTLKGVDAKNVGIEGVSRFGKAALVTMAFDQRFNFVLVGSSGEGGAKPHRHNIGEALENLTGGEYYWMAGNFLKYGTEEGKLGRKTAGDLPVDSHELIALCAPRNVFISYGNPAHGDPTWLDQQGSYMATVAAGAAWKLLGKQDLGVGNDYRTAKMPPVLTGLTDGQLAWRQDDGGHTDAPNMQSFLKWADTQMGRVSSLP